MDYQLPLRQRIKGLLLLPLCIFTLLLSTASCGNQQKLKSFNNVITADDSLNIELSK